MDKKKMDEHSDTGVWNRIDAATVGSYLPVLRSEYRSGGADMCRTLCGEWQ